METIDLTTEIEAVQPKHKAKSRAKAKAQPPDETLPPPEPKPKAKSKAKAKAKAKDVVVVDEEPAPSEPIVIADEQPASTEPIVIADEPAANFLAPAPKNEPPIVVESQPTVEEPSVVEAATTTRKPKGHRAKDPNKVPLIKQVACKKCDKTVSLHSAKYTHDKFCKSKSEGEPSEEIPSKPLRVTSSASSSSSQPLTLRDKLNAKRLESAKKLVSMMF